MSDKNVVNYHKQGGAEWIIGSGGKQTVESGGLLEVESGGQADFQSGSVVTLAGTNNVSGTLKIGGTTVSPTAVQLNAAPVRIINYEVEDLSANGDIANRPIFYCPAGYKLTISDILLLSQGTVAGVDADNTAVITLSNGTNAIATKTFNDTVTFPAIATVTNLGALSTTYKAIAAGEVIKLSITCGTSADLPGFVVEVVGTLETA